MATNLAVNVQEVLSDYHSSIHCWLDSTVALYWTKGSGEYRQFVTNRARKIKQHQDITWRHVPTDQNKNTADVGSRGGNVSNAVQWINGPSWFPFPDQWPTNVDIRPLPESSAGAKEPKEVLAMALPKKDEFTQVMEKYNLKKTLRICAW